jgi:hypothetical protein
MWLAVLFLIWSPALAQNYPPLFPRDGAKKVAEDDHFVIWDVTWEKGKSTGMHELPLDQVTVNITVDGLSAIKITKRDGTESIEQEKNGSVRFESKGTVEAEEGASDRPSHAFVFQLKDVAPPHWPIKEGVPSQFPRVAAVKLFETNRIVVWDDTWLPGMHKPLHDHYTQQAVTYYQPGVIRGIHLGVPDRPLPALVGVARIVGKLATPHEEEQLEGTPHAIWVQFKYDY